MKAGVRTEWHLAEMATSEDPFMSTTYSGVEIDLGGTEEDLTATLKGLLERECRLYSMGLACEIKDGGQDCRTCPMATLDPSVDRASLCRIGKDQFAVAEGIEAYRAPITELGERVEEWVELAQLSDADAELLEALGV